MTDDVGGSWRDVYRRMGCDPDAHEEEQSGDERERVTGVTPRAARRRSDAADEGAQA